MSIYELFRILWVMPAQQLLYSFETAGTSLNLNNTNLTLHYKFYIAQKNKCTPEWCSLHRKLGGGAYSYIWAIISCSQYAKLNFNPSPKSNQIFNPSKLKHDK